MTRGNKIFFGVMIGMVLLLDLVFVAQVLHVAKGWPFLWDLAIVGGVSWLMLRHVRESLRK